MTFLVLVVVGFLVGRKLGAGRGGFAAIAAISVTSAVAQITHLLMTADRSRMTMLPLVAGTLVVVGLFLGAMARRAPRDPNAA